MTRRGLLGLVPQAALLSSVLSEKKNQALPQAGEFVRFADPTTEAIVVRLTSPAYTNILPLPVNRFASLKPRLLMCSSDRGGGRLQPFQIDLRTGAIRQIAEADALDASSLTLDAQSRFVYFLDGLELVESGLPGRKESKRTRVLAKNVSAFGIGASPSQLFTISAGGALQRVSDNGASVLATDAAGPCLVRPPAGAGCLFARSLAGDEREYWYAAADPAHGKPVLLARGRVSNPCWSGGGESVLFLRDVPKANIFLSEVHEIKPEEGIERCVSKTSQFATFNPNGNGSVFVGASGSKAQPNVVLLLRLTQRELTLCEHRSSHPSDVRPAFSPDSRRVYFQTDREGKPAIYSVNVEQLVEPTEADVRG